MTPAQKRALEKRLNPLPVQFSVTSDGIAVVPGIRDKPFHQVSLLFAVYRVPSFFDTSARAHSLALRIPEVIPLLYALK